MARCFLYLERAASFDVRAQYLQFAMIFILQFEKSNFAKFGNLKKL